MFNGVAIHCLEEKDHQCYQQGTISCCKGSFLQIQNETTATCIKCLPPGELCYQINIPCCPGYGCGVGGVHYYEPRPGERCRSIAVLG